MFTGKYKSEKMPLRPSFEFSLRKRWARYQIPRKGELSKKEISKALVEVVKQIEKINPNWKYDTGIKTITYPHSGEMFFKIYPSKK